ncbi:CpaF family protein [bacterium]|nr:CpaF family protein [bacterium]NCQ54940.1 CpaF family protein [Candidatus Parcubacteria bacterium]NCS66984.1 CpaF family protein [Candidatus Peregrinibacteria bacterium]NCS95930.1 CpaF family protein [bacterium]
MSQMEKLHQTGVEYLLEYLRKSLSSDPLSEPLEQVASHWLSSQNYLVPQKQWLELRDSLLHAVVGFGPLELWLKDPQISEIMVNGYQQIYLERGGKLELAQQCFASNDQLLQVINRMVAQVGRRIDASQPLVDARLPDGSRINVIIPPLSLNGPVLTIRKFPTKPFKLFDLIAQNSVNKMMADLLSLLVQTKQNILISGGTGAGKTSTLNALAMLIPHQERLITIEDSAEIRIDHPHLITLESRANNLEGEGSVSIRDLIKNALRMRPDRIVVGEIRGGEALDMLQAMNTGHQGSITTVHANAPLESLYRLETMVLMGDVNLPITAIRPQIKQGINWILQQKRLPSGKRKITQIAWLNSDLKTEEYDVQTVAYYDERTKTFKSSGFFPEILKDQASASLIKWCQK